MMKELLNQFNHAWKMFYKIVNDFDAESWIQTGCSYITPARISYHIIGGTNYYIENTDSVELISGKKNDWNWENALVENLPTKEDIIHLIHMYKTKTEEWINNIDLEEANTKFGWTGKNRMSVVLFLLRHMEYHIGELNLLLHMSKNGNANDNWVKALEPFEV